MFPCPKLHTQVLSLEGILHFKVGTMFSYLTRIDGVVVERVWVAKSGAGVMQTVRLNELSFKRQ